jgi:hypothetical protein
MDSLDVEIEDPENTTQSITPHQVHGNLMCIDFGVILPLGILAMRWKPLASFTNHWVIQMCFVFTALFGVGIALKHSLILIHD